MGLSGLSVRRATLLCSSVAALAAAAPIAAHAADAATQATATATNDAAVGELVVTARKREERLIDAPQPIKAVSGEALRKISASDFSDYLVTIPGINFSTGREGSTLLVLRGIATGAANPTVATYIDEAPFGSSTIFALGAALTPDFDPSDLERVEVLPGPQGTLYGANAIGGILKFVTLQPNLTNFSGRVEVTGEAVDHGGDGWGVRGMVNIPVVNDKLAIRISGYDRDDPGFIDDVLHGTHDINDAKVWGGRVDALWRPVNDLTVRVSAMFHGLDGADSNGEDVQVVTQGANHGVLVGPTYGDLEVKRYLSQPVSLRYALYNGTITWTPGPVSVISSTSYSTEKVNAVGDLTAQYGPLLHGYGAQLVALLGLPQKFNPFPANLGVTLLRAVDQTKLTEEARIASSGEHKLDWQLGVFFTTEASSQDEPASLYTYPSSAPYTVPAPFSSLQNVFHANLISRYTETSVFGSVDYHFTPRFDITLGGRYSYDWQTYVQPSSGLLYGPATTPTGSGHEDAFTYLVNPRFKLNEDNTLYIRIASGYRPGGPNAVPPAALTAFPRTFGPDFLTDYEGGWKAELFDHRVSVDTAIFYLQWSKMQLPTVIGGYTAQANGGKAHSEGAEGQLIWSPIQGLSLGGDATYTNAVLDSNNPDAGAFKGDHLPFTPKWNIGLTADYTRPIAEGWIGDAGLNYRHQGERPNAFTPIVNPAAPAGPFIGYYAPMPAYYTLDLHVGATHEGWRLVVFARNVTDQRGITSLGPNTGNPLVSDWVAAVINPRTVGVSVSKAF
ncbi:MAG TPA: TonB-dependent receptor [Caulobacteraceae bacterium]|nr:TonB-dependent receptor [Caulobacteraceae bacterium]